MEDRPPSRHDPANIIVLIWNLALFVMGFPLGDIGAIHTGVVDSTVFTTAIIALYARETSRDAIWRQTSTIYTGRVLTEHS